MLSKKTTYSEVQIGEFFTVLTKDNVLYSYHKVVSPGGDVVDIAADYGSQNLAYEGHFADDEVYVYE